MSRRGATGLIGVLAVDKPSGMTSHDVVAAVRRATGEGRVGHAGTLDPMATGLLVVLIGAYTRLEPYISAAHKTYEARIAFGTGTDTDDAEGAPTRTARVPADVLDADSARALLASFLGPSMQRPPAYSAIKVAGRVAHRAARGGEALELAERPIEVTEADLLAIDDAACAWDVRFTVSKGTYVRALARDIALAAGTAGHLAALRRTRSGTLDVTDAHSLDDVRSAAAEGDVRRLFADPLHVTGLQAVEADGADVAQGRRLALPAAPLPLDAAVAVTVGGRLAAVYRVNADGLRPEAVFAGVAA